LDKELAGMEYEPKEAVRWREDVVVPELDVLEDLFAALDLEEEVADVPCDVPCDELPDLKASLPTQPHLEMLACRKWSQPA
jgi:hypothetical protein